MNEQVTVEYGWTQEMGGGNDASTRNRSYRQHPRQSRTIGGAAMRTKPYTEIGIRRLKCYRCGSPATQQWQICADGNQYRPICTECDIELNEMVLRFMGFDNVDELMQEYRRRFENG